MNGDWVRALISGLVGGLVAVFLLAKWARYVPKGLEAKPAERLIAENRIIIYGANALFFATLGLGVVFYEAGLVERTDWRGLALTFGAATLLPVIWIFLASLPRGRTRIREAYVAYAISQRTPLPVLYLMLLSGVVSFCAALGGWLQGR